MNQMKLVVALAHFKFNSSLSAQLISHQSVNQSHASSGGNMGSDTRQICNKGPNSSRLNPIPRVACGRYLNNEDGRDSRGEFIKKTKREWTSMAVAQNFLSGSDFLLLFLSLLEGIKELGIQVNE